MMTDTQGLISIYLDTPKNKMLGTRIGTISKVFYALQEQ